MLGQAGATVYCTGRSTKGRPATKGRAETIEETADIVTARGGAGIAVQVDHTVETQVQSLFARVQEEQGRLDILINDIWGGDALTEWGKPFWELSTSKGLQMLQQAVHTHIITSRYGVPLMVERKAGLIVEITDGDFMGYRGNVFYDLVKSSVIRLAYAMAADLRDHDITAIAVTPGFLRSEAMLDHFGVTEANWRDAARTDPHFAQSETSLTLARLKPRTFKAGTTTGAAFRTRRPASSGARRRRSRHTIARAGDHSHGTVPVALGWRWSPRRYSRPSARPARSQGGRDRTPRTPARRPP